jgi:hypothetical protein
MRNWSTWKEGKSAYPLQNDAGDSSYSQCGEKDEMFYCKAFLNISANSKYSDMNF